MNQQLGQSNPTSCSAVNEPLWPGMNNPEVCLQYPKQPRIMTPNNQPNNVLTEITKQMYVGT